MGGAVVGALAVTVPAAGQVWVCRTKRHRGDRVVIRRVSTGKVEFTRLSHNHPSQHRIAQRLRHAEFLGAYALERGG